jgi:predicted N-formylglutamate amidohydrolase
MFKLLDGEGDIVVGNNEPYSVTDETDYSIPVHAEQRGLPHLTLEIRQDLIADKVGQTAWAARLANLLPQAVKKAG